MLYDLIIIGAGASGMMAGITAAARGKNVLMVEFQDHPAKKILATGNGKCNMTNMKMDNSCFRSSTCDDVMSVIDKFSNKNLIEFFKSAGLITRERDGYVYPYNEQAQTVFDVLNREALHHGVNFICNSEVSDIKKDTVKDIWNVCLLVNEAVNVSQKKSEINQKYNNKNSKNDSKRLPDKKSIEIRTYTQTCKTKNLLIATGSSSGLRKHPQVDGYRLAKMFGHSIIKTLPALTALTCKETFFKDISGVRAKCLLSLYSDEDFITEEYGELQLTDYGISGIPVFQISRFALNKLESKSHVTVKIDFMPEYTAKELEIYIRKIYDQTHNLEETIGGLLNKKISSLLCKMTEQVKSSGRLHDTNSTEFGRDLSNIVSLIKNFPVTITGSKGFEFSQVTQGGVPLTEINLDMMESKITKGLFFSGEVLDVDGICGGYNLQWAFTSGYIAGTHVE